MKRRLIQYRYNHAFIQIAPEKLAKPGGGGGSFVFLLYILILEGYACKHTSIQSYIIYLYGVIC